MVEAADKAIRYEKIARKKMIEAAEAKASLKKYKNKLNKLKKHKMMNF